MADYETALKVLKEVADTGEDYEICEEQDTVFNMLDSLGMGLDEDHQDLQDQDKNEKIDLLATAQGGHSLSEEELKSLDGLEDITGVSNLGSLLADFVKGGGQVIGIGPGESYTFGI